VRIFLDANVCLDLFDTSRHNAKTTVAWYMHHKDNSANEFYFSGDFITTIYYVLTEKKKLPAQQVIEAINQLSKEVVPVYLKHQDFLLAQRSFFNTDFKDFEDLIVLHSALRAGCETLITNDQSILKRKTFEGMKIVRPESPRTE